VCIGSILGEGIIPKVLGLIGDLNPILCIFNISQKLVEEVPILRSRGVAGPEGGGVATTPYTHVWKAADV
jgi:hypothetical protein